jgi:hypothetical protein
MDILKTNGNLLVSIGDGTINSEATPLQLPGRNVAGYGQILNENLVHLLEHFANSTEPTSGIVGQLWFNTTNNQINVKTQQGFKPLTVAFKSGVTPASPNTGEMWWNTTTDQLKIYNGSTWRLIGPDYENSWQETGFSSARIADTSGIDHLVVKLMIGGVERMIISKDADFVPSTPIVGFSVIKNGINVSSQLTSFRFRAAADDSAALGGIDAGNYLRKDQDTTVTATYNLENGVTVGPTAGAEITVSEVNEEQHLVISNSVSLSRIDFKVNVDGFQSTLLTLLPNGEVRLLNDPIEPTGAATKNYVDQLHDELTSAIYDANTGLLSYLISNVDALSDRIGNNLDSIGSLQTDLANLDAKVDTKANIASPTFTGSPTAPTPTSSSNDLSIATTEFVVNADNVVKTYVDAELDSLQSTLIGYVNTGLALKSTIVSPTFTGSPSAPTPSVSTNTTQIANTAWVRSVIQDKSEQAAYWQGSRKFVSTADPTPANGDNGDFWFKYQ